jgi:hypothetical protein
MARNVKAGGVRRLQRGCIPHPSQGYILAYLHAHLEDLVIVIAIGWKAVVDFYGE